MQKTEQSRSFLSDGIRRFRRHKLAMISLFILLLELLVPLILHMDPTKMDTAAVFTAAPSAAHILGTDTLGRDVFARVLSGGRTSLYVGIVSTIVSAVIGIPLGLAAGY